MTPDRSVPHHTLRPRRVAAALAAAAIATASLWGAAPAAQAQQLPPFADCDPAGYLFQVDDGTDYTQALRVDLLTGAYAQVDTIPGRSVNAIGYNVLDDYVYGWDVTALELVRVGGNFEVEPLGRPSYDDDGNPVTPAVAVPNHVVGDVDPDGFYWMLEGPHYWQIDLRPGSASYAQVVQHGDAPAPTGVVFGADWAFVAGTGHLWMVGSTAATNPPTQSALLGFNLDTRQFDVAVRLPNVTDIGAFGAVYADANGFLYASANTSGNIWRIEVENPVNHAFFAAGPSATGNDGMRCGLAPLPIDFGDAPDSYGTTLSDDGARHGIDPELVLGTELDVEVDGQPGEAADGDDEHGVADEDAVDSPVRIDRTAGTFSLTVPVTDETGEDATLAGWIDFNHSGAFETGERTTAPVGGTGDVSLTWPLPADVAGGDTFLRLRLFPGTVTDPGPVGAAAAGEVEDHLVAIPAYEIDKTADPPAGTAVAPGVTVTYTVTVTNTGAVDLVGAAAPTVTDDLSGVLDDARYNDDATASDGEVTVEDTTLVWTGDLPADTTVTITYSVTVGPADDLGDGTLANLAIGDGPAGCAATRDETPCGTAHPVAAYRVEKSANPADEATVAADDKIVYTLTLANTGTVDLTGTGAPTVTDDLSGVLDDATYNGGATASAGTVAVTGDTLTWTGDLATGAVVTVTYSVTVRGDDDRGDDRIRNAVAGTGPTNCAARSTNAGCAVQHVATDQQAPGGGLPGTGVRGLVLAGYGVLLLLLGTGAYVLSRRRAIE